MIARNVVIGMGRTPEEAVRGFFEATGAGNLQPEQRAMVIEELGHRLAIFDLARVELGYSETFLRARMAGALEQLGRTVTPDERRRLVDGYRSTLHLHLLRTERLPGGASAVTDNDRWVWRGPW